MADSVLSSLLSRASNRQSASGLADNIKISRVSIKYSARAMRHMLETGVSIVDARIIDPVAVSIEAICPTLDDLNAVNTLLRDRSTTYDFSSRGIAVTSVTCDDIIIRQTPDMISASPIKVNLKQLLRQGGNDTQPHQVVEQPADSSIFARGIQQVEDVRESIREAFSRFLING